jgi:RHS repeat-associated protein
MGIIKRQYDTIDGRMIGYHASGVQKDFLTDALGSVTAEVDQACTKTFEGRYKPYGGNLSSPGSRGSFGWIGTWGYRETGLNSAGHYVRTRYYSKTSALWNSSDPEWPAERPYTYCNDRPSRAIDRSGTLVILIPIAIGAEELFLMIIGAAAAADAARRLEEHCRRYPESCRVTLPGRGGGGSNTSRTLPQLPDIRVNPNGPCGPRPWTIRGRPWDIPLDRPWEPWPMRGRPRTRPRDRSGPCTDWSTQLCFAGCAANAAQHDDNLAGGLIGPGIIIGDIVNEHKITASIQ